MKVWHDLYFWLIWQSKYENNIPPPDSVVGSAGVSVDGFPFGSSQSPAMFYGTLNEISKNHHTINIKFGPMILIKIYQYFDLQASHVDAHLSFANPYWHFPSSESFLQTLWGKESEHPSALIAITTTAKIITFVIIISSE